MNNNIETFSSLSSKQKEAIGLLSVGTFLEYFDLMLYIHMAVLLNELFFPKTDPYTANLISAFAFCSTFVFRPLGAIIFGRIGDSVGRKITVIITTFLMAISCCIMAILPTYAEIGVMAAFIVTICRVAQGMASMGESIGAEIYLTETIKPPAQYPAVAFISVFIAVGTMAAVGIASLVTSYGFNWRFAFLIGAGVALVGAVARTALRETADFANAKRRIQLAIKDANHNPKIVEKNIIWNEAINKKTVLFLFLMQCSWPACFYIAYFHCGNILKSSFGCTPQQIIHQNFVVSVIQLLSMLLLTYLSYKIYPLIIVKIKLIIFSVFTLICPILLNSIRNPFDMLLFQSFFIIFTSCTVPAVPILFKHFPIFKRYTYTSVSYALSRAFVYIITSFGFIYLTKNFGQFGILFILIPVNICFASGLRHFERLEKEAQDFPKVLENNILVRNSVY
ncbi:MAG: MFS transporter [Gammaproteobacteria bacterium]